ncbi:hypothetical protein Prum_084790 [Phytohabitans rumicis]|uniref:Uncharacterized protein n=1 Tax=Phytohabitans rumicis TaxID=1076125 RepID=A0A6V8LLA1_9ACTN|nr:hypothetical protein Prum_084790 [Phytohabitans rumicis]
MVVQEGAQHLALPTNARRIRSFVSHPEIMTPSGPRCCGGYGGDHGSSGRKGPSSAAKPMITASTGQLGGAGRLPAVDLVGQGGILRPVMSPPIKENPVDQGQTVVDWRSKHDHMPLIDA